MKKLLMILVLTVLTFTSCAPYKMFVNVIPAPIPFGSAEIIVKGSINDAKSILQKNTIMFKEAEGGLETEEILIDEGTKAKYRFYVYEENLKIIPYWGITSKVKSTMTIWAGYQAASAYSTQDWDRAIYEKGMGNKMSRPGMVFAYGYQLAKEIDPNAKVK